LLDGMPPQPVAFSGIPIALSKASVALRSYGNTEVEIEADSQRAGFVVLNDVWHPWWFGTVDGKPAKILRANVLFRAIQVPAGKHTVRFEFKPVQGAMMEIAARIQGKPPLERMPVPADCHIRPEANARELWQIAAGTTGTLR